MPPHSPGEGNGWIDAYLRWLAVHPLTARRISAKLATRFVSDAPPASLVDRMARTWTQHRRSGRPGAAHPLRLRRVLGRAGQKVRTPQEDYVATLRTLGTGMETSGTGGITKLFWHVLDQGHAPMAWGAPNGYPDVAVAWTSPSGTLSRWNRHMDFAAGWYPPELAFVRAPDLLTTFPTTWGALVDALGVRLTGSPLTADERAGAAAVRRPAARGPGLPRRPVGAGQPPLPRRAHARRPDLHDPLRGPAR